MNRPSVRIAGDMQKFIGQFVLESDRFISAPEVLITINDPIVPIVTFAIIAKSTYFLIIGKGRLKKMAVQVFLSI
jgi:hypothetical protein